MKLKEILNIPGTPGLFKVIAQAKSNIIIESLIDGKRQAISATHRVNTLGDISVFTNDEEMPLAEVFKKMKEGDGEKVPVDAKSEPDALRSYFKKLIPDIDEERVHVSHMKKMLNWYELLKDKIDFNQKEEDDDSGSSLVQDDQGKPIVRSHEMHAPKADQHAKTTTAKTRKKV